MKNQIVHFAAGLTLFAGGQIKARQIRRALAVAPIVIAADKGALAARAHGVEPQAIFGDFDHKGSSLAKQFPDATLYQIAEQDTTDFEKAIYATASPFVIALGVTGDRLDHSLAAMRVLVQYSCRLVIVMSGRDMCFLAPPSLSLSLQTGIRLSLFPMGPVQGESTGLKWPIGGIAFDPGGAIGTSNETISPDITLTFDQPRMLVILNAKHLGRVLPQLLAPTGWKEGDG